MEMKRKQKHISLRCSNQGFTMIELPVAMVVSLLAMAAIIRRSWPARSHQVEEETAEMQQNIRTAMFYMQREVRMAGSDPFNVGDIGITVVTIFHNLYGDIMGGAVGTVRTQSRKAAANDSSENITYALDGRVGKT